MLWWFLTIESFWNAVFVAALAYSNVVLCPRGQLYLLTVQSARSYHFSTALLLQKWLASKSSALVPSCNILNSGFHYFPFLSLVFCYQYLLCLVKYWPRDHFVTVNLDNLDSPRKCVSVASTLAPLRASLWWTFQHAPRWKDAQVRSTPLEKGCSVDAGFGAFPSGRFLQVFRHFAFVQKAFQVLTSRSLYFYLGIDG